MKAQMICFIDLALASKSDSGFYKEVAHCSCEGKHCYTPGSASDLNIPVITCETVGYTRAKWLDLTGETG